MTQPASPLVSIVLIGYKRPDQLKQTVESLLETVDYEPLEVILADDCSPEELREPMRRLPFDRFVFADRNRGLGANTNAGLNASRGKYVLQLQDDWLCTGPSDFLSRAVRLCESRPSVGIVRFTRRFGPDFDLLPPCARMEGDPDVLLFPTDRKSPFFLYSDQPHLKSRRFIEFIGPYKESRNMQTTEIDMRRRFNRQDYFEAAFIEGYHAFEHIGEEVSLNAPRLSARLAAKMDRTPLLRTLAASFRSLRGRIGQRP